MILYMIQPWLSMQIRPRQSGEHGARRLWCDGAGPCTCALSPFILELNDSAEALVDLKASSPCHSLLSAYVLSAVYIPCEPRREREWTRFSAWVNSLKLLLGINGVCQTAWCHVTAGLLTSVTNSTCASKKQPEGSANCKPKALPWACGCWPFKGTIAIVKLFYFLFAMKKGKWHNCPKNAS